MKVSMKGDYGVRALVELAHHFGEGPVQSAVISGRQGIPEPYLDQLLTGLRRAGFIRSVRGPQGGHALIRDPRDLRLSEASAPAAAPATRYRWPPWRRSRTAPSTSSATRPSSASHASRQRAAPRSSA